MVKKSTAEAIKRVLAKGEDEDTPANEVRKVAKVKKVAKGDESEKEVKGKKVKANGKSETKAAGKEEKSAKKKGGNRGPQEVPEGHVSVAELAEEAEITAQSARVKLRSSEVERPEGRWIWKEGSKELKKAREVLGL